jgi:tungstate transport system substrate-binding protein
VGVDIQAWLFVATVMVVVGLYFRLGRTGRMWTGLSLDVAGTAGASARPRSAVGKNFMEFCAGVPRGSTRVPKTGDENGRKGFGPGIVAAILAAAIFAILLLLASQFVGLSNKIVATLSSSTEPEDSGLFDYILPIFRDSTGLTVQVVAVGTGRALAMGERGDADALLVHDPIGESKFMAHGYGVDLRGVMYDDFVIVGPDTDPAGIRGLKDASKAFAQIASAGVLFASRGDDSGTNRAELRLWKLAGIESGPRDTWYRSLDRGMGPTLNIAAAMNAYTLTSRATWANFNNRQHLEILTAGDPMLLNPYTSILVNPAEWPHMKFNNARTWHEWLTSKPGADAIASYRINGMQVFFPLDNGKMQ